LEPEAEGKESIVMEVRLETERALAPPEGPEDRDLRDGSARAARRPVWFAAVVVLDTLAIAAFITWVVIPRLI
jgi:hypothetical protein